MPYSSEVTYNIVDRHNLVALYLLKLAVAEGYSRVTLSNMFLRSYFGKERIHTQTANVLCRTLREYFYKEDLDSPEGTREIFIRVSSTFKEGRSTIISSVPEKERMLKFLGIRNVTLVTKYS